MFLGLQFLDDDERQLVEWVDRSKVRPVLRDDGYEGPLFRRNMGESLRS